ncbi:MAG: type IV secretory system conjugative DNA transfer family protein [Aureliella sp.]
MFDHHFRRLLERVPGLPQTLRQSLENPTQVDRLPDSSGIETEFPAYCESRASARKIVRRTLFFAAVVCLFRSIPEYFLPIPWAYDIFGIFASIACVTIVCTIIGVPTKLWHYGMYLFALPALVLYILYLRSMFALLLLAAVFTAIVADRFAKLSLYLGTTTPFSRPRAKFVRSKWSSRFFSLNTVRGLEFYGLMILALAAVPFLFDRVATASHPEGGTLRIPALAITLGVIVLLPIAFELLSALLYSRKPFRLSMAWKGFKRAFVDWNCYNSKDVQAPGILLSPVGSAAARRRILVATIYLWSAAIVPLVSYQHVLHERLAWARSGASAEKREEQAKAKDIGDFTERKFSYQQTQPHKVQQQLEKSAALELWSGDLKEAPLLVSELQPYQLKLLERMPEEQRSQYVREALGVYKLPEVGTSNTEDSQSASEPEEQDTSLFFLFSKMQPPDNVFGSPNNLAEARFGFVFSFIFLILGLLQIFLLLFAFGFPLAFLYAASVRVAANLREQLETRPDTILSFGNWNRLVKDIARSNDETEQSSLLLGTNKSDGSPVLVPRKVFEEHAHILGDSGSGKTSLGISLLLNQLIKQPACSIVVIDLKGDDAALFTGAQLDAQEANKRFRWYTNELHRSSYAFNPLNQEYFKQLSLYQKTDVLTSALGLQYGTDYGRGYYSDANADYLYRVLQAHPGIRSFQDLASILPSGRGVDVTAKMREAATHSISIVQRLACTETLNVVPGPDYPQSVIDNQIDFADVFRTPQVVYLQLPASLGSTSSAEIARVALYSLLGSARQTPESKRIQTFVFIDEFQRIIANNLELLMQTARSMRIGLILANQTIFDLAKAGVDLRATVRTNTRFKQVFAASNVDDIRELIEVSGEALVHSRSFSHNLGGGSFIGAVSSITSQETTTPRLRTNDILLATDAPDQSIVQIRRGDGYAQFGGMPFVMRSQFHIDKDTYDKRKESPWPEVNDETILGKEVEHRSPLDELPSVPNPLDSPSASSMKRSSEGILDLLPTPSKKKKRESKPKNDKKDPS